MTTKLNRVYHLVKFFETHQLNGFHCVPASWVKWQDGESTKVLLAYPDEPQEITDFYDSTIRDVNECGRNVEECSSGKVICTKVESPNASSSLNALLSFEMNNSDAFSLEYGKWLSRQLNSDDPRFSMVNRIDEVISLDSEVSDQEDVEGDDKDFPLDLSMPSKIVQDSRPKSIQDLRQVNNTHEILYDPSTNGDTDKNLTLKHQDDAQGVVELIPNSGVYISVSELFRCLESSTKCTKLARLLTKYIFTRTRFRNCLYVKSQNSLENYLKLKGTAAIAKFVINYGLARNWRPSCEKSVKMNISYQLRVLKKLYK